MKQQQAISPADLFDQYFGPSLFTPWAQVLLRYAAPQPGERVLDVACGTSTVARQTAPLVGSEGRVVGLDINPGMLAIASTRPAPQGAPIEWRQGDAAALDLPDQAFDLVLCQQGLQFFLDRVAAAGEMRRVLAPGGRAVLSLWQALELHPLFDALCQAESRYFGVPLAEVSGPWSLADADELRSVLSAGGFRRIEVVPETLTVRFPSPDRFVDLTINAAAAFLPQIDQGDAALRAKVIDAIRREIEPTIERYREGDSLVFPTTWNIAVAYAE